MFNFLSKKETETIVVDKPIENSKRIVTSSDIQNEMNDKLQWLLGSNEIELVSKEVDDFESQNKEILEKAKALEKLGFTNTPSVKLAKEVNSKTADKKKEIALKQDEIELTKKYSLEFPMYKFVPERIFQEVRENYDLYTSETTRYIKEIPDKNVSEIENFIPLAKKSWRVFSSLRMLRMGGLGMDFGSFRQNSILEDKIFYNEDDAKSHYNHNQRLNSSYFRCELTESPLFEITAPINHFNLDKTEIQDRDIKTKIEVLDPIVTHKVEGGRIIVSVWDKEADIPEIKNSILN